MSLCGLQLRGFGATSGGATPAPPAAPTLAVADSENGTQAVATITGSTTGATNAVEVAIVGALGSVSWTSAGSRTGNGTVTMTLARGYYWARVVSTKNDQQAVSNLVYFAVTNGTDAIAYKIGNRLVALIQALALSGVSSSSIVFRKVPYDRQLTKPCIIVCPGPENLNAQAGSNIRDDIDYRFVISFTRASNEDLTDELNTWLRWREQVRSAIHNQRLVVASLANADPWRGVIEPGTIYIPESFAKNFDVAFLTARITTREARNL